MTSFFEKGGYIGNSAAYPVTLVGNNIDPHFANVSLLIGGEGTNSSTTFTDESPEGNVVTVGGNAQVTTTNNLFSGGGILLDGTGDYLSIAASAGHDFGTGDFTVECFSRMTSFTSGNQSLIAGVGATNGDWMIAHPFADDLQFGRSWVAWDAVTSGGTISAGTWYHMAASRVSGVLNLYIGGTRYYTGANTQSYNITSTIAIGARQGASGVLSYGEFFNGQIQEARVTKGVGRYSGATITVPTDRFPRQ